VEYTTIDILHRPVEKQGQARGWRFRRAPHSRGCEGRLPSGLRTVARAARHSQGL